MFKRLLILSAITVHSLSWSGMETNNHSACKAISFLSNLTSLFEGKAFNVSSSVTNLNKALSKSSRVYPQLGTATSPTPLKIGGYNIGEFAQGGVVIWVTDDKQHGLVASIVDLGDHFWAEYDDIQTNAYNDDPLPTVYTKPIPKDNYSGYQNQKIILGLDPDLSDYPVFLACANYSITINGTTYGDWFLPSPLELYQMYNKRETVNTVSTANGGYGLDYNKEYWSSCESQYYTDEAFTQDFGTSFQYGVGKAFVFKVRCVRAF